MSISLLPDDLLLEVLGHSQPLDVLSLGQTCSSFHDLTSDRHLWEQRLRRLCTERGLFQASYPPKEQDLGQLQRTVSSHHLWENIVRRCSVLPAQLEAAVPMQMEAKSGAVCLEDLREEEDVLILHGGRYLVSLGFDTQIQGSSVCLKVLDLGLPGCPILGENHVVSVHGVGGPKRSSKRSHQVIGCLSTIDESTVVVVVLIKRRRNPHPPWGSIKFWLTTMTLSFEDLHVKLQATTTIKVTGSNDSSAATLRPSVAGNQVLVHLGDGYFIWNFKKGWYKYWAVHRYFVPHEFVPFTGDFIMLPGASDIAIWNAKHHQRHAVPQDSRIHIGTQNDTVGHNPPDHSIQYPWVSPFSPSSFLFTLSVSKNFKSLPMVFDVLHRDSGMRLQLSWAPSCDGLDNFGIEFLTYYVINKPLNLHRSWPHEELRFGFGSSALVHPAMGKHYTQPYIYSLSPEGRKGPSPGGEDGGLSEVWEGGSVMMVAPVLPVETNPSWISVCSASGRVFYRVEKAGPIWDEEGGSKEYWCVDVIH